MKAAESWAEQRIFNELAARALETAPSAPHPLAKAVREELSIVENVEEPDTSDLKEFPLQNLVTFSSGTQIQLGSDGSLVMLRFPSGEDLASPSAPFGGFSYQTFNDTEWKPFTYASWKKLVRTRASYGTTWGQLFPSSRPKLSSFNFSQSSLCISLSRFLIF